MFGPFPIRILAGIAFKTHGLPRFEDVVGTRFFGSIGLTSELKNALVINDLSKIVHLSKGQRLRLSAKI
jgi:hypothetical protein